MHASLDDKAFEEKSLQHVLKHFSTRFEYIRRKSCIWTVSKTGFERYEGVANLSFLNDFCHMSLLGGIEV